MKKEKVKYIKRIIIKNLWGEINIDWKLYNKNNPVEYVNILFGDNGSGKSTILDIIESVLKTANIPQHIDVDYVEIEFDSDKKIILKKIKNPEDQLSSALNKRKELEALRSQYEDEKEVIAKLNVEYLFEVMLDYATRYTVKSINFFDDENGTLTDRIEAKKLFNDYGISKFVNLDKIRTFDVLIKSKAKKTNNNYPSLPSILADDINFRDSQSRKDNEDKDLTELDKQLIELINELKNYRLTLKNEIEPKIREKEKKIKDLLNKDSPTTEELNKLRNLMIEKEKIIKNAHSSLEYFLEIVNGSFKRKTDEKKSINLSKTIDFDEDNSIIFRQENDKIISWKQLSSGEKQLLIILLTVLLEKQEPTIMLMDEPEASLHITWQHKLINHIRKLNPNSQLIIVTHSGSIFSKGWLDRATDMEEVVSSSKSLSNI
ncbi:MAG: AAA family ATPase [Crocosphaera sp.]